LPSRGRQALRCASIAALLSAVSACAVTLFTPPVGPGEPAPDAATVWAAATRDCRTVTSYTGSLRVSGRIGGDRLPVTVTLVTGATPTGLRLEGTAAGRNLFLLAGTDAEATLYLDDGHRFAQGRPEELTAALVGVSLGPARWLALLNGCLSSATEAVSGVRYGPTLGLTTSDGRVFLAMSDGAWQVQDGLFDGIIVTYRRWIAASSRLPADWRFTSEAGRDPSVSLAVTVDHATAGRPIPATAFTLSLPADAVRITIDQLRQSGPLRQKGL
jgi:hypothetical protein